MSKCKPTLEERFWAKVDKSGGPDSCWLWTAARDTPGYGVLRVGPSPRGAHRISYELLVGPIPPGLVIDHLCRVLTCVNPAHLEPVTVRENNLRGISPAAINARKEVCIREHEFDGTWARGDRYCGTCNTLRRSLKVEAAA